MQLKGVTATRGSRWALALAVAVLCLPATASAATDTFTNANGITIPSAGVDSGTMGPADPYPSTISVGGLNTPVLDANATLTSFTHTCTEDVDILLVGPAGQQTILLSDAGHCTGSATATVTLDDEAAGNYPCGGTVPSGSFKPTDCLGAGRGTIEDDNFDPPAPGPGPGLYPASLAVFDGSNPNGTWSLYVVDDADDDFGSIASWSLTLTTPDSPPSPPAPPATPSATPPKCFGRAATMVGTAGDDNLAATAGPDVVASLRGDDRVSGLDADDVVCGGRGDDHLSGGPGDDVLIGGAGSDVLNGGTGSDRLFGGTPGNAVGGSGEDGCKGAAGDDTLKGCETGSE